MLGKFALIFILAHILPPGELGVYGLFTVTISYSLYMVGLDFYTYSGRSMVCAQKAAWPSMMRDQAVLFLASYTLVIPLLGIMFWVDLLPINYAYSFFTLLLLEHLSQEFNRLLIIAGRPVTAGWLVFIRSGAWGYALIAIYGWDFAYINLHFVFLIWIVADVFVVLSGVWIFRDLQWRKLTSTIDWLWIGKGLRIAGFLLIGTLAIRSVFTLDRYMIDAFSDKETLGVYTLYAALCFSIISIVDASVFSFRYPSLVTIYKSKNYSKFLLAKRTIGRQAILVVTVSVALMVAIINPVLEWIGEPIYLVHLPVFFTLLGAAIIYAIGHIPHYALYAMGQDRSIVISHMAACFLFIILGAALAPRLQMLGVSIALLVSMACLGAIKQWKFIVQSRFENDLQDA